MEWIIIGGVLVVGVIVSLFAVIVYWIGRLLGFILSPVAVAGIGIVKTGTAVAKAAKNIGDPEAAAAMTVNIEEWAKDRQVAAKNYASRFIARRNALKGNEQVEEIHEEYTDTEGIG